MIVQPLSDHPTEPDAWNGFVNEAHAGTAFQTLRFMAYHPPDRFQNHHLVAYSRRRLFAVIPGAVVEEPDGPAFISYPGASYGGPVIANACSFDNAEELVGALISYAQTHGFARIDLTLTPLPYLDRPNQTLAFALLCAGFVCRKRELTQCVDLGSAKTQRQYGLPSKTRADIRQARKNGLRTEWTIDPSPAVLETLYALLIRNRIELGLNTPPTHTLDELNRIRGLCPGLLWVGATFSTDGPVATTLVFRLNSRVLLTFYICHERTARDLHPVHLLLSDLIEQGVNQGYRLLDFGISSINMNPLPGLIRFKESFNSQGFLRETFELRL